LTVVSNKSSYVIWLWLNVIGLNNLKISLLAEFSMKIKPFGKPVATFGLEWPRDENGRDKVNN